MELMYLANVFELKASEKRENLSVPRERGLRVIFHCLNEQNKIEILCQAQRYVRLEFQMGIIRLKYSKYVRPQEILNCPMNLIPYRQQREYFVIQAR
jgi:hypothetical protein